MKDIFTKHFEVIFEMSVLLAVFVIGGLFLIWQPDNQQLASWVTGGAIIGVLARALSRNGHPADKKEPQP